MPKAAAIRREKSPPNLTRRGGVWWFQRRVPAEYLDAFGKTHVFVTTKIKCFNDPKGLGASKKATEINAGLETLWQGLLDGKGSEARREGEHALATARRLRIGSPIADPSTRAIPEILARYEAVERHRAAEDRTAAAVALDAVTKPKPTFQECAEMLLA